MCHGVTESDARSIPSRWSREQEEMQWVGAWDNGFHFRATPIHLRWHAGRRLLESEQPQYFLPCGFTRWIEVQPHNPHLWILGRDGAANAPQRRLQNVL